MSRTRKSTIEAFNAYRQAFISTVTPKVTVCLTANQRAEGSNLPLVGSRFTMVAYEQDDVSCDVWETSLEFWQDLSFSDALFAMQLYVKSHHEEFL